MHRCWEIPELVEHIFSNFTTVKYSGNRKELARLGRTCKSLGGPALDGLWRQVDDLMAILKCMPSDLFTLSKNPNSYESTVKFLRPIVPSDWDRAAIYLPRVKEFDYPPISSRFVFREIFPALRQCLPPDSDCIFPNLVKLWWHPNESQASFRDIHLFLASTLTSILIAGMPSNCIDTVLPALSAQAARLTKVRIDLYYGASDIKDIHRPTFATFIRHLAAVRDLSILLPDAASLEHVGRLATLARLELRMLPRRLLPSTVEPLTLFANLSELTIGVVNIAVATSFMAMCTETAFQSLCFTFKECPTDAAIDAFFLALTHCRRSHASLRSLGIRNAADGKLHMNQQQFLLQNRRIAHLFCFANLTRIEIEAPCGFELNDAVCGEMARAWPHAERLTLKEDFNPAVIGVTLESLRAFAQHCPDLNRLYITFDARVVPKVIPSAEEAQLCLEHLEIGHSILISYHPRFVAKFIGALFPNLRYLEIPRDAGYMGDDGDDTEEEEEEDEDGPPKPDYRAWEEVLELLPARRQMYGGSVEV
ncbi:hypothetical protein C8R46DRAFT_1076269, partial [Mycena filopes]